MQRGNGNVSRKIASPQNFFNPLDFGHAGKEDKKIALALAQRPRNASGHGSLQPFLRSLLQIDCLHREAAPVAGDDWGVAQQLRYRLAIKRGGHDKKAQIGAKQALRLQRQHQPQIGMDASLVELIKITTPNCSNAGSDCSIRASTPSVRTSMRVVGPMAVSIRVR
ncbi:MAG: hypothetical protein UZ07_CHB004002304 [Chlorobi bacterium OLB7]|nr:MAG: hypothetical protein UZ07_CHB004002304 [Chlorobi bacterium OLB7]